MKWMLSCQEVSRLLSAQQDQKLPVGDSLRMRMHLSMCAACSQVETQMHFLRRAMQKLGKDDPPRP